MTTMFSVTMELKEALNIFNSKADSKSTIYNAIEELIGDDFEIIENTDEDGDIRIHLTDNILSRGDFENLQTEFKITLLRVDSGEMQMDLRLKE